jgi:molybdopterin-guanine dinucleotide biosynthesis protein A
MRSPDAVTSGPRPAAPLRGLVLAGGRSRRMQSDKALLQYHGKPQVQWMAALLAPYCESVHVSVRAAQAAEPVRAGLPVIVDEHEDAGPIAGILAAQRREPASAWLVVACDLPFLDAATLEHLVARRAPARVATAYRSAHDGLPEPLCAIWEPSSVPLLRAAVEAGRYCPRALLGTADALLLDLPDAAALDNVNTREEWADARARLGAAETRT